MDFEYRVAGEHVKASTKRSSKVCYLSDGDSRLSAVLSQRIGDVTELQVKNYVGLSKNSEDLQVLKNCFLHKQCLCDFAGHELWNWWHCAGPSRLCCYNQAVIQ